jgi:phage-related protein
MGAIERGEACQFCGFTIHDRAECPARDIECRRCSKKGHYARVCQSAPASQTQQI